MPVKDKLVQRRVLTDAVCDHCKQQPKDVIHV